MANNNARNACLSSLSRLHARSIPAVRIMLWVIFTTILKRCFRSSTKTWKPSVYPCALTELLDVYRKSWISSQPCLAARAQGVFPPLVHDRDVVVHHVTQPSAPVEIRRVRSAYKHHLEGLRKCPRFRLEEQSSFAGR